MDSLLPNAAVSGLTTTLDLGGVFANAVLGGAVARLKNYDAVGFVALGLISGLGGGIIRDTLLQQGPPLALTNISYLVVALAGAIAALMVNTDRPWRRRSLESLDSIALGLWSVAGAQTALAAGLGALPAVLLGVITAVGGGATRDVITGETPAIFTGRLYATCALVASIVTVIFAGLGQGDFGGGTRCGLWRGAARARAAARLESVAA